MTDDEIIAVVQAHKEGKRIQSKGVTLWSTDDWRDDVNPRWDFSFSSYRVAPEPRKPREWIVRECPDGYIYGWDHTGKSWPEDDKTFRVREII